MPSPTTLHDSETTDLLLRISKGDEQAFAVLFRKYYPAVYRASLFVTNSNYLAEEVVQDIFLKLWLRKESVTAISDIQSYLFIATRNQAYKALRKQLKQENPENNLAEEQGFNPFDDEEMELQKDSIRSLFDAAVEALPQQQKQAYKMSRQSGMTRMQIAETMQLSPETVKKYIALASLNIRAYCQKHAPELLPVITLLLMMQFSEKLF